MNTNLPDLLAAYNGRRRRFLRRRAAAGAAVAFIITLLAAVAVDVTWLLAGPVRLALAAAMVLLALAILQRLWLRPARRCDADDAARTIEQHFPELGQMVRTAQQAEQAPGSLAGANPVLLAAMRRQTAERLAATDLERSIPWHLARPWLAGAAGSLILVIAIMLLSPVARTGLRRLATPLAAVPYTTVTVATEPAVFRAGDPVIVTARLAGRAVPTVMLQLQPLGPDDSAASLRPDGWTASPVQSSRSADGALTWTLQPDAASFAARVLAGDGISEPAIIRWLEPPVITATATTVESPAYIGLPPVQGTSGTVAAISGSRIFFEWQISCGMDLAAIRFADGQELPMEVAGDRVRGAMVVQTGRIPWRLVGRSLAGLDLLGPEEVVTGIEDRLPDVRMVDPSADLRVTKLWELPIAVQVTDDHGLAEAGIILKIDGVEHELWRQKYDPAGGVIRTAGPATVALFEQFNLAINDNVSLYAWARDRCDERDARGLSRIISIDIREFREDWKLDDPGQPPQGEGESPEEEAVKKLEELIRDQRRMVSDIFPFSENPTPDRERLKRLAAGQDDIMGETRKLHQKASELGDLTDDDLTLLDVAAEQMDDAADSLRARAAAIAFRHADAALTSLIEARKHLIKVLKIQPPSQSKSKSKPKSEDQEKVPGKSPQELAAWSRRLAEAESRIADSLQTPRPPHDAAAKAQQEVSVETGELHDALIANARATDLLRQRMADVEDTVFAGEKAVAARESQAAATLRSAAAGLNELATHLEGLDPARQTETLEQMRDMAENAAKELQPQPEPGGSQSQPGKSPQNQPQSQEQARNQGQPGSPDDSQPPAGASPGQSPGSAPGQSPGEPSADKLAEMARDAQTLDDWLSAMEAAEKDAHRRERLDDLAKKQGTGRLDEDLKRAADLAAQGHEEAAAKARQELHDRFQGLAEQLRREHRAAAETLLEQLARNEALAREALAAARNENNPPGQEPGQPGQPGQEPGQQPGPGTPGGGQPTAGTPGQGPQGGGAGQPPLEDQLDTLRDDLQMLPDEALRELADSIPDAGSSRLDQSLSEIASVLQDRIKEILLRQFRADPNLPVPPQYRELIDEYTRRLSDDLDVNSAKP